VPGVVAGHRTGRRSRVACGYRRNPLQLHRLRQLPVPLRLADPTSSRRARRPGPRAILRRLIDAARYDPWTAGGGGDRACSGKRRTRSARPADHDRPEPRERSMARHSDGRGPAKTLAGLRKVPM
jgi:hypothetical protein